MDTVLHVVMLPWSAFGHMMPFFQLSIALAKAGIRVSFISTPRNIQKLPEIPPNLVSLINFVEFRLPVLDNELLPEDAEATVDISFDNIPYLKTAYDLLEHQFRKFIFDEAPNWIILDVIPHWAVKIAQEHRVLLLFFSAFSAATIAFLGPPEYLVGEGQKRLRSSPESLMSSPEWISFPSSVAFRKHEAIDNFGALYGPNGTQKTDAQRIAKILHSCQAVAIRTCTEYEGKYLNLLEKILRKPVIPVGLLPPERPKERELFTDRSWGKIFQWLAKQKPNSVVFVGFGSECKLSKEQVYEIAYGLELSQLPFLWALRKPNWAIDDSDALPPGFSDRTHGKGLISLGWAPQMEILAHSSIGGSLFHSGWGSVIETLQFGHCLLVLPFMIDQPLNARLLVEKGLAVEIQRSEDGSFSRNDIANSLRKVMVSDEGEGLKVRAREAAEVFGDYKLHQNYIDRFVEYMRNGVKNNQYNSLLG